MTEKSPKNDRKENSFQLWFECCKISASVIGNVQNKNIGIGLTRKSLIDRALPKIQSNLASNLAQLFRIYGGIYFIVKTHKDIFPSYYCFRSQRICCITIAVCS